MESPFPGEPAEDSNVMNIQVYGGVTASGTLVIQLAKLSGLQVVATCSKANHNLMFDLGADALFDDHDPELGNQTRENTDDALEFLLDTILNPWLAAICNAASDRGVKGTLSPGHARYFARSEQP